MVLLTGMTVQLAKDETVAYCRVVGGLDRHV